MAKATKDIDFATISALHQMNPWWRGNAMERLPETRRNLVLQIEKRFEYKLAPVTVIRGSRQIGKTTACLQVISDLLKRGVNPGRILRVQFDDIESFRIGKDPELDFVITSGDQRIPIEVKYRNTIRTEHYRGLERFVSNPVNRAPFGILVTRNPAETIDERFITIPFRHFLLLR